MDLIIQPEDYMVKIDKYYESIGKDSPAIFVARVVNQKMLFYKMMPDISVKKPFTIDELDIPKDYSDKREDFRIFVRQTAKKAVHEPLKVI
jgi:hypothetical protein